MPVRLHVGSIAGPDAVRMGTRPRPGSPSEALAAVPRTATAGKGKQVRSVGIHPVPKAEGGGVCHIEGPHVHVFAANKLEYRDRRRGSPQERPERTHDQPADEAHPEVTAG